MINLTFWRITGLDINGPSNHLIQDILSNYIENGVMIHYISCKSKNNTIEKGLPLKGKHKYFKEHIYNRNYYNKSNFIMRYIYDSWLVFKTSFSLLRCRNNEYIHIYSTHVSSFQIFMIRIFTNSKIILNVQDIFPQNAQYSHVLKPNSNLYKLLLKIQKYSYLKATKVITISEDMKNILVKIGVDKEKINLIYNWGNYEFTSTRNLSELGIGKIKKEKFVLYAGNVGTVQNLDMCISLFLKLDESDLYFLIVGDGNNKKKLQEKWKNNNKIIFLDFLPAEIVNSLYSLAIVNIIPLIDNIIYTALPSKTPNCLKSGKPLISIVNVESFYAKIIHEYSRGYVIDADDFSDENDLFKKAFLDTEKSNGEKIIKKYFEKAQNLKKYLDLLKENKL